MSKVVKEVVFTDEEPIEKDVLDGLKEFSDPIEEIKESVTEQDIDELFSFEPLQVDEISKKVEMVEVTPVRDFQCSFANQRYFFVKGKSQRVSVALRDFLLENKVNPKIRDLWT